jgi:hypothetical protein
MITGFKDNLKWLISRDMLAQVKLAAGKKDFLGARHAGFPPTGSLSGKIQRFPIQVNFIFYPPGFR